MTDTASNAEDAPTAVGEPPRQRPLPAAARRALAEAAARRAEIDAKLASRPREFAGRDGPEPVRYGDWEVKGLATDF